MGVTCSFSISSSFSQDTIRYLKDHSPYCQCCANHGVQNRLNGHKKYSFQSCKCLKCKVVKRRRRFMTDQIREKRRLRKLAKDAKKASKNYERSFGLKTNHETPSFAREQTLNIADITISPNVLDALQCNKIMPYFPQSSIPMTLTDSAVPFAGINSSNIGSYFLATSISPSIFIAKTPDELNISVLALLESMKMAPYVPPSPTFPNQPLLNLCALQPSILYSSMDLPVSSTMPLPMFPPNQSFTYSNSVFSLPNTFLEQIQQSFF